MGSSTSHSKQQGSATVIPIPHPTPVKRPLLVKVVEPTMRIGKEFVRKWATMNGFVDNPSMYEHTQVTVSPLGSVLRSD